MASEDTIYMGGNIRNESSVAAPQPVNNGGKRFPWKTVTIGGVTGVLLGAGSVYGNKAYAQLNQEPETQDAEGKEPFHTLDNGLKVADVSDDLSFKEAFDLARSEVGAGGAFHWHGNTYSTYNESEWNAMSDADKAEYAELVRPEITPEEIGEAVTTEPAADVAEAAQPEQQSQEVHVHHHYHQAPQQAATSAAASQEAQPSAHSTQASIQQPQTGDDDVQVVASGTVKGHQAVAVDLDGNGDADVMVIDTNDNEKLDDPDLVVYKDGNMATVGHLAQDAHEGGSVENASSAQANNVQPEPDQDVQVVASGTVGGHQAAAVDLTGNGEADVMVVDANDNYQLDDPDVVVDREGNMATVGQLAQGNVSADHAGSTQANNVQPEPDDDVQVIARGTVAGHEAVALDLSSNGEADVVVIDANDNYELDNPDVVVDAEGNMATVEELTQDTQEDYGYYTNMEDQDMTSGYDMDPSMPDPSADPDLVLI